MTVRRPQDFALKSFRDKLAKSEGSRQVELTAEASVTKLNEKVPLHRVHSCCTRALLWLC
jgi:hypothetical protein